MLCWLHCKAIFICTLPKYYTSKNKHAADRTMKSTENCFWVSNELSGHPFVSAAFIYFLSEIIIAFTYELWK